MKLKMGIVWYNKTNKQIVICREDCIWKNG